MIEGDRLELRVHTGGPMFALKGVPRRIQDLQARVSLQGQRVRFDNFLHPTTTGWFGHGDVSIERAGAVQVRVGARPSSRKLRWDELDLLYFLGYALWNYIAVPRFMWDLPHRELSPRRQEGQLLRRVAVRFPDEIHTHSREQVFYVDGEGRTHRHDYTADVFGAWAKAAHLGSHHEPVDGTWLAKRRRVVPRLGPRALPGPTLVWIELEDLRLGKEAATDLP